MTAEPLQLVRDRRPPPASPPRTTRVSASGRRRMRAAAHPLIPWLLVALWALAIDDVRLRDMTDLGLVSVMPATALALLTLLTLSFCAAMRERPLRQWVTFSHALALIVMLYGVTALLEPQAGTASAYGHAGVIDVLARAGSVDAAIDANFGWPGFFALGALISQAAGLDSALSLAPWMPLGVNLLLVAPLLVIFRWASDDPRVWWLGLWVFLSCNWVAQDQLSPQAIGFVLWLTILAALLSRFTPRPAELRGRPSVSRVLRLRAEHVPDGSRRGDVVAVVAIVVMFAAIVSGHGLTPLPVALAVSALVLLAGLRTRGLPVLMAVLVAAWLGYPAIDHVDELAGVGAAAGHAVSAVPGGGGDRALVVDLRLAAMALIWLLAVAGLARRIASRRLDVAFALVAAAPLALLLLRSPDADIVLTVFLFTLPVAAFFVASSLYPTQDHGRGWPATVAVAAGCLVLVGLFQVTRYGDERLDSFTRGDVAVVDAMYVIVAPGSTVVGAANLPWRSQHYGDYDYRSILELAAWKSAARPVPAALVQELAVSSPPAGSYVIVTRSMEAEASLLGGKAGVLASLVSILNASPTARLLFHGDGGDLFHLAAAAPQPPPPPLVEPPIAAAPEPVAAPKPAARKPAEKPAEKRPPPAARPPAAPVAAPPAVPQPVTPPPAPVVEPAPPPPPAPVAPPPPPAVDFDDSG